MDYTKYSLKEKVQIAAIIIAISDKIQELNQIPISNNHHDILSQIVAMEWKDNFEKYFKSVVASELALLQLPSKIIDNATLSFYVWKNISDQKTIIERMFKIFIKDLEQNKKTELYASYAKLAIPFVFNVRLKL